MKTSRTALARVLFMVVLFALSYPAMAQLKADFSVSTQSGCTPLIVSFKDISSGTPDSWKWDLGGGVTSVEQNPTTSYFDPGVYSIKLTIYKDDATDSIVKIGYITVYENPKAAFTVSDSAGCFPLNVAYTDKSKAGSGTINAWTWDFGDGNISSQPQPSHSYSAEGTFSVTLSVTNIYGCSNAFTRKSLIHVSKGVHANYSVNAGSICHAPANFNFTSTATGDGTLTYAWNFGDGNVAAQSQVSHNYNKENTYTVSLKVTSSTGCADSISRPLNVKFVQSAISANENICLNKQVQFVNTSSPAPASSTWSFGDKTTSNIISPYKTYSAVGQYTVKVINTFFAGCIDSAFTKVKVVPATAASFKVIDSLSCSLPFTAHFKNTSAGSGLSFVWDFGDGTTSTNANPSHEYTNYGTYTVVLKVVNKGGCESVVTKTSAVTIQPVKITGITGFLSGCIPYSITPALTVTSAEPVTKYSWDFGDGGVSALASPTHTYNKEGIYTVKVSIETAGGCTDSLTIIDSVGHKLHPDFTVNPASVCASQQVNFSNTTKEESSFLWWDLGDGTVIYKQPDPGHNYSDTGFFTVTLVVEENGCMDTIIKKNAVHISGPIARFNAKHDCTLSMQETFLNKSIEDKTRRWDFGDGNSDTSKNPVHVYKATGVYKVQLFVSNGTCTYTGDTTIKVVNEKGIMQISDTVFCRSTAVDFSIANVNAKNIAATAWTFLPGNTVLVKGIATTYNYSSNGIYNPSVVVTDILGCTDTLYAKHRITIFGPTARFNPIESGACKNGNINFTDNSLTDEVHPLTSWVFDYGDKTISTYSAEGPFTHTYQDTGLYTVKMTVTDTYGCADAEQKVNAVHITKPYASFKLSDTLVCPGKQVSFNNTTIAVGPQYSWKLGDGTETADANPRHLYTMQGIYTPQLFVTDINGCKDSALLQGGVHVFTPSAKFLMSDSFSACPPLSVSFTNQSANFAAYQWSFGDGNTSGVASPAHIYTYPGVYLAKLVLSGNGGCMDSVAETITIKGPTGQLQYADNSSCYPSAVQFKAVSKNAVQYLWDYSDGNTRLTGSDTSSHVYSPGTYLPKIILIDAEGCKVPVKGLDTLKVYGLQLNASVSKYLLCDSGKIVFTDSSVTNDVITSSKWIFDDNTIAAGASVTHYYSNTGTYSVKLTDVTANGCTDTLKISAPIKVVQSPVVSITGTTSFCVPATVSLQAVNTKKDTSAITWNWDFGNGVTTTVQNPSGISLPNAGDYKVSVSATNSSSCAGISFTTVTVHALPKVSAGSDTIICRLSGINLQATGASAYTWATVPGISCTSCSNPVVKPESTQTYTVTGKDSFGCSASDSVVVGVSQPVHVTVSNNDTLCNGETKQLTASGAKIYQWFPALYLSDAATDQPTFNAIKDTSISYKVIGYDEKKCFADSANIKIKVYPIPQMQITQTAITASSGSQVKLTTINSADVTKWKWSPAIWLDNPSSPNPVAQPRESITYTVVAANDGACVTRAQVAVTVICNGTNIFVPNTFSPNGDGMNEVFYPRGTGLYNIKSFRIFNRLGQLVFEKMNTGANNAADGWDGTLKGQKAPADVYVYIIEVLCNNNTVIPVKGNITLLR